MKEDKNAVTFNCKHELSRWDNHIMDYDDSDMPDGIFSAGSCKYCNYRTEGINKEGGNWD